MDLKLFQGSSNKDASSGPPPERGVKNYFFIYDREHPKIDLGRYEKNRNITYYGKLFLSITAQQDMFIGSGEIDQNQKKLYDAFSFIMKSNGTKIWNIPGSSLKGCITTHLAMFLQKWSLDIFSAQKGKAKVFFSDLPMTAGGVADGAEIIARFSPRAVPQNALIKLYKKEYIKESLPQGSYQREPGKEIIQAIRKGSRFTGHINFKELNEIELTILVLALGSMPENSFNFKLGGAKNRAMGLVKLKIDFEKSFYANTLKDIADKKTLSFTNLTTNLGKNLSQLKQEFPALEKLIKRLQKEYGQ